MNYSLSLIIPAYKAELTLDRCIRSIVSQSFQDWEICLIDDGSPDHCPEICDEWAAKDERIRVAHQKNRGLSAARNRGIGMARGLYITFVDSDDELAPDTLQVLMKQMNEHPEYDILEYPVMENYQHPQGLEQRHIWEENTYTDFTDYWLQSAGFEHCWACNKIFKRRVFDKVAFATGCYYEDVKLMGEIASLCPVIHTTSAGLYLYYYNGGGISKDYNGTKLTQLLENQLHIVNLLNIDLSSRGWSRLTMRLLNIQIDVYKLTGRIMLQGITFHINHTLGLPSLIKSMLAKTLGIRRTCEMWNR